MVLDLGEEVEDGIGEGSGSYTFLIVLTPANYFIEEQILGKLSQFDYFGTDVFISSDGLELTAGAP